jgi:protein-S-isoprenylcysteine O-methyltransferase Ste14
MAADLGLVQAVRKIAFEICAVFALALLVLTSPRWGHSVHRYMEAVGIYLVAVCILGRTLCSMYITGHKSDRLIDIGPYSICRNPLYVFSLIGAIGVGLMSGSIVISLLFGFVVWLVQRIVVSKEEAFLLNKHGESYREYMARVPRFWPDFSLWNSGDNIVVRTRGVLGTFADASLFLLAIPVMEVLEFLKESGSLPVLLELP